MTPSRTSTARPRVGPRGAAGLPEPPDASFWLERTPLPTAPAARRTRPAAVPGRSAMAPPSTVCPKCDSPLSPSEKACPSCGLKRAMFGRFRANTERVPQALEELWLEVEQNWSDPTLHERFLSQVSLCGAYAYAASRYRRAARLRQSDAISKLQLDRLSRMVHAVMAVSAVRPGQERGARPYRRMVILVVLLVGLGGIGALYMVRRGASEQERVDRVPSTIRVRRGRSLGSDGRPSKAFGGLRAPSGAAGKDEQPEPPSEGAEGEQADEAEGQQGDEGDTPGAERSTEEE